MTILNERFAVLAELERAALPVPDDSIRSHPWKEGGENRMPRPSPLREGRWKDRIFTPYELARRPVPAVPWCIESWIPAGAITLLSGQPKAGKSTFVGELLRAIEHGTDFLDEIVHVKRVLVISEEVEIHWRRRIERLDLSGCQWLDILTRPFTGNPALSEWVDFINEIRAHVETEAIDLVVFDTLAGLWGVADENAAPEVKAFLAPLFGIAEMGAGVIALHHTKKNSTGSPTDIRGSSAILGIVDSSLMLRLNSPSNPDDPRRILTSIGRFEEIPRQTVIELHEDGYSRLGDRSDVTARDRLPVALEILAGSSAPLSADQIRERWPSEPKPAKGRLSVLLNRAFESGDLTRNGKGAKGDPYVFTISEFDSVPPPF